MSDSVIIFASIIKGNLESSRREGKPIVFTHILLTMFFLPSWCSMNPSFIIYFLFRELPLAIHLVSICGQQGHRD